MVRCSDGTIVSVMINDQAVQEYQVEETRSGLERTTTCYIEAKEGDEFQVKVINLPSQDSVSQLAKIFLEGELVQTQVDCRKTSSMTFRGYQMATSEAQGTLRAFSFGKMQTTNDDSVKKMPGAELQNVCTTRVEFTPRKRCGPLNHMPMMPSYFELPSPSIQHEESKPSLWGLSAVPGREIHTLPLYSCNCDVTDDPEALRHIVIFRYFSHQWLVMKGIKQGNREDDEVALDAARTDRTAVRRRTRLELLPWARNVRIKRESSAITIKDEDEARKGQRIIMDLADDGEYVAATQSIAEVIVIEDD